MIAEEVDNSAPKKEEEELKLSALKLADLLKEVTKVVDVTKGTLQLQMLIFLLLLASLFRIFSIPLGIILLVGAIAGTLYFAPVIRRIQNESSNDLNTVLFWVVIYFAVIIAITIWGG